jgi:hypothetical protein
MPPKDKPRIGHLEAWLAEVTHVDQTAKYWHRVLKESHAVRPLVLDDIKAYFKWAHRDSVLWIRSLVGAPLDPLGETAVPDPILKYPCNLMLVGLQGCFGEIFAGLLAEHYPFFGVDGWEVPAFLDRFHNTAFEELEARDPYDEVAKNAFGRTGDDCLAFLRKEGGKIQCVLYCESKCCLTHDSELVNEAHQKLTKGRPVNILQVIDVLQRRGDAESLAWVDALRRARYNIKTNNKETSQCNMVSYICGRQPVQKETWMDPEKPHAGYKATHGLAAIEVHLHEVESLIRAVYHEKEWE